MKFSDDRQAFCHDVELMLQDYLDGYLLPSQREILEAHVRGCGNCRELLAGIHRMDDRLEGAADADVDVPPNLARAILDALPAQAYRPSPLRRALAYGVAPVLALALLAGGFLLKGRYLIRSAGGERVVEVALSAPAAASVSVVGDFNGWDPRRNALVRSSHEGRWQARLRLHPGTYQYSFVIDGVTWTKDPSAKSTLSDGFGGENSVMVVDG